MSVPFYVTINQTGTAYTVQLYAVGGISLASINFTLSFTTATGTYVSGTGPTGWTNLSNTSNITATPTASGDFGFADFTFVTPVAASSDGLVATLNFTLANAATPLSGSVAVTDYSDESGTDYGAGPTLVLGAAACFGIGTRIATPDGDVPVEQIVAGDRVSLARGGSAVVRWVGYRDVDCARHPRPQDVNPVRVARDAFGPGMPAGDLMLSPDHAVFVDDVLIPVRYLLNGATVRQVAVDAIAYFHVELDSHDVLLAEGLPAESFLDTGNRGAFANGGGVTLLHPDFARGVWEKGACAPLATEGAVLEAVRGRLLARAEAMGFARSEAAEVMLDADGVSIAPEWRAGALCFALPEGPASLVLRSASGVPAELQDAASGDPRRLGVAVAALEIDGVAIGLGDAGLGDGWYPTEDGWRWTDGAASLGVRAGRELRVVLALVAPHWRVAA